MRITGVEGNTFIRDTGACWDSLTSLCWPERWTRSSAAGYTWTHWRWLHSLLQEKSPQTHAYHTYNTTETHVRLRWKGFWSIQTHGIICTSSGEPGKTSFWAILNIKLHHIWIWITLQNLTQSNRASYHLTRQCARGGKSLFMQSRSCMASGYASESRRQFNTRRRGQSSADEVKSQAYLPLVHPCHHYLLTPVSDSDV